MNDSSELDKVREAAERTLKWNELLESGDEEQHAYYDYPGEQTADEAVLIDWAVIELARREAEAAERSKPITEEWLRSIGFMEGGPWLQAKLNGICLWWSLRERALSISAVHASSITTRGQLLDLLHALGWKQPK